PVDSRHTRRSPLAGDALVGCRGSTAANQNSIARERAPTGDGFPVALSAEPAFITFTQPFHRHCFHRTPHESAPGQSWPAGDITEEGVTDDQAHTSAVDRPVRVHGSHGAAGARPRAIR